MLIVIILCPTRPTILKTTTTGFSSFQMNEGRSNFARFLDLSFIRSIMLVMTRRGCGGACFFFE